MLNPATEHTILVNPQSLENQMTEINYLTHQQSPGLHQPQSDANVAGWLGLSLLASLYFGLVSFSYSLSQDYIVQDDVRIHVVWLQRFIDPQLFKDDLIAQYHQAIQPIGFKAFYGAIAQMGIAPLLLAKVLPLILGLITTVYLFKLTLQIFPVPACACLTTLMLNQNIWLKDDLISATPRAFIYPIFAAFLYYLLRRSLLPCLITIALQGLFYPQLLLIEVALLTLRLMHWQNGRLRLTQQRSNYILWLLGSFLAGLILLTFSAYVYQAFGALVTAEQIKTMPEFGLNGRREYFGVEPLRFMFGGASGLRFPLFPPIIWMSLGLPLLLQTPLPLVQSITPNLKVLPQILLASLSIFILSHGTFPKLYHPSRYTFYSFRFVMAIAAGIVLTILLKAIWQWLQREQRQPRHRIKVWLLTGFLGLFLTTIVVVPAVPALFLPCQGWVIGEAPELYQFLLSQPQGTLIASLAPEADNLPAFSQRSILVSREYALAYHPAFYQQMKQRMIDLVQAEYSPDLSVTKAVIQKYGIDFFLLDRHWLEPDYLLQQDWLIHSEVQDFILDKNTELRQGAIPALASFIDRCSVTSPTNWILLSATCLQQAEL